MVRFAPLAVILDENNVLNINIKYEYQTSIFDHNHHHPPQRTEISRYKNKSNKDEQARKEKGLKKKRTKRIKIKR